MGGRSRLETRASERCASPGGARRTAGRTRPQWLRRLQSCVEGTAEGQKKDSRAGGEIKTLHSKNTLTGFTVVRGSTCGWVGGRVGGTSRKKITPVPDEIYRFL